MAPEQIQGRPTLASDQYALGIVIYEWLAGERPFKGSVIEVTLQHLSVAPIPLVLPSRLIPGNLRSLSQRVSPRLLVIVSVVVVVIMIGGILISSLAASHNQNSGSKTVTSANAGTPDQKTATVSLSPSAALGVGAGQGGTPDASATVNTSATIPTSASIPSVGTPIYTSDWSKSLGGWIGSGQW
jgi:serine/threonine protein kinase